jgi:large subunit ribosomal protein L35Ae
MEKEYLGVVMNYRIGLHKQKTNQGLIKVKNVEPNITRQLIGYTVSWPHINPKITGRVNGLHGRSGTLRVKFRKGLPGQALGSLVTLTK